MVPTLKMVSLTGKNLGERHKELNMLIREAVNNELKYDSNGPDVENIFNIDLASEQKKLSFIFEIFKSGDEFAITRALNKATWIYDQEFAHTFHAECLARDVFPSMSIKMKKKLLTKITVYLKDEKRITEFYHLCLNENLYNIALKFLNISTETQKLDEIGLHKLMTANEKRLRYFIGNSITLATYLLESLTQTTETNSVLFNLRYIYSTLQDEYLQLLETYYIQDSIGQDNKRFGLRLSRHIMKTKQRRILENPSIYMKVLSKTIIVNNSTRADANVYAASVLPEDVQLFWDVNYCVTYEYILKLINENQKFSFVKNLFTERYPDEEFEMHINFYALKWYDVIMTDKEKDNWASQQIASGNKLLGHENDYIWYQFKNFDCAFENIQKLISETPKLVKKSEMFDFLVDSAKTPKDLEKVLNCYYEHYTEEKEANLSFVDKIINAKQVLLLNEECWVALEKLFNRCEIVDETNHNKTGKYVMVIAVINNIINKNNLPDKFTHLLDIGEVNFDILSTFIPLLSEQSGEKVFQHIFNYYVFKTSILCKEAIETNARKEADVFVYLCYIADLLCCFKKTKHDIGNELYQLLLVYYRKAILIPGSNATLETNQELSEGLINRYLKDNGALAVKGLPKIKQYIENRFGKINWLIKKIRTYFSNDLAKMYADYFEKCCNDINIGKSFATVAVRVIITLGDESTKLNFVQKYSPSNVALANHKYVPKYIIHIQHAICKQACFSRPPLPLKSMEPFITEEFIPFCIPMLQHNLMNLPHHLCTEFLASIVTNKPFVIQKFGARLALDYLNVSSIKIFCSLVWRDATTNAPLRKILYKLVHQKFLSINELMQQELFETLKFFTKDLKENDEDLLNIVGETKLPDKFMGEFLAVSLEVFNQLPKETINFQRMTNIMRAIHHYINLMPEITLDFITTSHINEILHEKQILETNVNEDLDDLVKAKWDVIAKNLIIVHTKPLLNKKLAQMKNIITLCSDMWFEIKDDRFIVREFCINFLKMVESNSYTLSNVYTVDDTNINILINATIDQLESSVPEYHIYMLIWNLRLSVGTRNIIMEEDQKEKTEDLAESLATSIIECMLKLANVFGTLMKEYISRNTYFPSFINEIELAVADRMLALQSFVDMQNYLKLSFIDMHILLCRGLLEFELPEIYMFMCKTLPVDYSDCYVDEYTNVIKAIKSFPNKEIQYYLYDKFVNGNGFLNIID